jgi:hypothetical protein
LLFPEQTILDGFVLSPWSGWSGAGVGESLLLPPELEVDLHSFCFLFHPQFLAWLHFFFLPWRPQSLGGCVAGVCCCCVGDGVETKLQRPFFHAHFTFFLLQAFFFKFTHTFVTSGVTDPTVGSGVATIALFLHFLSSEFQEQPSVLLQGLADLLL